MVMSWRTPRLTTVTRPVRGSAFDRTTGIPGAVHVVWEVNRLAKGLWGAQIDSLGG